MCANCGADEGKLALERRVLARWQCPDPQVVPAESQRSTPTGDLMTRSLVTWQAESRALRIIDRALVGRGDMPSLAKFKEGSAPEDGG
jgi:hypothetical protein